MKRSNIRTHGYGGYSNGCRCGTCRTAKAAYIRDKRAKARAHVGKPVGEKGRAHVPGIKHGIAGYKDHLCRCEVCTEAKRVEGQRRTAKASA